jgi:tripartite-type tricarboxylate transporter receptor subunit TctC
MRSSFTSCRRRLLSAAALLLLPGSAYAAEKAGNYPERPIRIIITVAPGAGSDMVARLVSKIMTERMGQNVVVDSRPGGGGVIASDIAAKADPDGYTLYQNGFGLLMQGATKRTQFDVLKTFEPVARLSSQPYILMVSDKIAAKNMKELIAESKSRTLTYAGSSGIGSAVHLGMERFAKISGMKIKYVAYKGSSPSIRALMGGEINMAAGSAMASTAAVNTGKVRAIANFGTERIPALPDLPTIGEQGFPGFVMDNSYILWVRSGTPRTIINHLNKVVSSGLNTPEYTKLLVASGSEPGKPMTPEQLKKEVAKDYAEIVETVKDLGLKF